MSEPTDRGEETPTRRTAVTSMMRKFHDAFEIEGGDVDTWREQGYASAEFEHDGWIMRVQIQSRKARR
jgi:hypothetical protein